MRRFPKELCRQAKKLAGVSGKNRGRIDFDKFDKQTYEDLNYLFMDHTRKYLTTISTAKYFLEKVKQWVSI